MSKNTYVVFWLNDSVANYTEYTDMGEALKFCESIRKTDGCSHVVISSDDSNQVGCMGVDSVEDGKLPDGNNYTWTKRRTTKTRN